MPNQKKEKSSLILRQQLDSGNEVTKERLVFITLPNEGEHSGHPVGNVCIH